MAESTHRPLYHVSTGELSANVKQLEGQLTEIFRLGLRWGAVVLLDEADVLMTKRSTTELERNAIVAGTKPPDPLMLTQCVAWADLTRRGYVQSSYAS